MTVGSKTATYAYDADGIRTQKTVDGVTHTYYTLNGKLMRESFPYSDTTIIMDFIYDESGKPFAVCYSKDGGANFTPYFYATNLQGDVEGIFRVLKNGTTGVYEQKWYGRYTYDAWGNVTAYTAAGNSPGSTTLVYRNPIRYRGYVYDNETGWYYLQSRYYDPANHRFINADSYASTDSTDAISCNMFAYCGNNPNMEIDPTGYWSWGGVLAGLGIIAGTIIAVATFGVATPVGALVAGAAITAGAVTTYAAATDSTMVVDLSYSTQVVPNEYVKAGGAVVIDFENNEANAYPHVGGGFGYSEWCTAHNKWNYVYSDFKRRFRRR